jgi:hypothetical protein
MLAYLPDEGKMAFGLAFFSAFNCIPAFVTMAALKGLSPATPRLAFVPFLMMSTLTIWAHYSYDLASDAQAAIWLVIAPLFVAFSGGVSTVIILALTWILQRLNSRNAGMN